MSVNSKKSILSTAALIILGLFALLLGASSLVVLIPAAIMVWYGVGPAVRVRRN